MKRWWMVLALLGAAACSNDPTGSEPAPPVIDDLQFSPTSVYVTSIDAEGVSISGSVDFTDADGDVSTLRMTTTAGADLTLPVEGAAGITSGTIAGTVVMPPGPVGDYGLTVWLVDALDHRSNTLSGVFAIRVDDSGIGWTTRPSGTTIQLNRVIAGAGGYLAVGYGGVILRSPDGLTWSDRSSGTTNTLWGAAWSGTHYVAVGEQCAIRGSADGVTWAPSDALPAGGTLYAVAWSGALFAAVGTTGGVEPTQVLTSADGLAWDARPAVPGVQEFRTVIWSGSRFVALGTGANDSTLVASSPDGNDWTVDARLGPFYPRDLCWSGTTFVAAGGAGSVLRSPDGVHWVDVGTGSAALSGVAWSGRQFLAVGVGVHGSADGLAWQQLGQEQLLRSVLWMEPRYIAVGGAGAVMTSP